MKGIPHAPLATPPNLRSPAHISAHFFARNTSRPPDIGRHRHPPSRPSLGPRLARLPPARKPPPPPPPVSAAAAAAPAESRATSSKIQVQHHRRPSSREDCRTGQLFNPAHLHHRPGSGGASESFQAGRALGLSMNEGLIQLAAANSRVCVSSFS